MKDVHMTEPPQTLKPPALDPATVSMKTGSDYPEPFKAAVAEGEAVLVTDAGDECDPDIDMLVRWIDGVEKYVHKDGTPYPGQE